MRDGTVVPTLAMTSDCRTCDTCPHTERVMSIIAGGWLRSYIMSADGCQIQCDIEGRPNEMIVSRYECDCKPGYQRHEGVCKKFCTKKYGDSKIFTCPDDPEKCCCPPGYTYTTTTTESCDGVDD
jgi:hypothetical protein